MILLLSKMNASERLTDFIYNLSKRCSARGFSAKEFRLTITRGDISNYLGFAVETISRLWGCFQKLGILIVKVKSAVEFHRTFYFFIYNLIKPIYKNN